MESSLIQVVPLTDLIERDAWETVVSLAVVPADGTAKKFLGSRSPRICRFCQQTAPEVTFRSEAHVIPAAFGNRSLFSTEECDECNQRGSVLENDLATFLGTARAISRIPGRKGNPKIRRPNERSYVQGNHLANRVDVHQPTDSESIQTIDDGRGTLVMQVRTPRYHPIRVAKSLARMMLFTVPVEFRGFQRVLSWLRGETEWFPVPIIVLNVTHPLQDVGITVLRSKGKHDNLCKVIFSYSSFIIVTPIPLDDWRLPPELPLLTYPAEYLPFLAANTSVHWARDNEPIEDGVAEFALTYQSRTVSNSGD